MTIYYITYILVFFLLHNFCLDTHEKMDLKNMSYGALVAEHTRLHGEYYKMCSNAPFGLPREKANAIAREIDAVKVQLDAVEAAIKRHPQHLANRRM